MGLSYYDIEQKPQTKIASALAVINALWGFGVLFYWSIASPFLGEPLKWAMNDNVTAQPNMFEYPYLTLWLVPILCMCAGWMALKLRRYDVARVIGAYPTLIISITLMWYYSTPSHWH